jgi:hypothetical protein
VTPATVEILFAGFDEDLFGILRRVGAERQDLPAKVGTNLHGKGWGRG